MKPTHAQNFLGRMQYERDYLYYLRFIHETQFPVSTPRPPKTITPEQAAIIRELVEREFNNRNAK